jgi:hypothetical protein
MMNDQRKARILNIDVELAPNVTYTWGFYNQYIGVNQVEDTTYILSFAAQWHGEKDIMFMSVYHDGQDTMIEELWQLMNEADAVMGWNSQSFDYKHICREFVEHGYLPPTEPKHIDLLKVVRKRFKFPSNKLDMISRKLDLGRKVEHHGFQLWRDCMAGDKKAWALMKRYNKHDVKLVAEAYEILKPWINTATLNLALFDDDDMTCPRCGEHEFEDEDKPHRTASHEYPQVRCTCCGYVARKPGALTAGRKVLK